MYVFVFLQEVDPSYNPVGFDPVRKVSYTFSLVSTLEMYEYPCTPVMQTPDVTIEDIDGGDPSTTTNQLSFEGQRGGLRGPDEEHRKRELSIIIEGNESAAVSRSNTEENIQSLENTRESTVQQIDRGDEGKGSEARDRMKRLQVTNPVALDMDEQLKGCGGEYIIIEESDVFLQSEVLNNRSSSSGSGGYITEDRLTPEGVMELEEGMVQRCMGDQILASPHPPPVVEDSPISTAVTSEDNIDSKVVDNPLATTIHHNSSSPNDGYIPSNFSTTSSGYGSESVASSSYKSRFLSTSSYATDTSVGPGSSYIPSDISTVSSGYVSECGVSSQKRGSFASQYGTPRMPQYGSSWTGGDYITDVSLCVPLTRNNLQDSDHLMQPQEPKELTISHMKHSPSHRRRKISYISDAGYYVDSVFNDNDCCTSSLDATSNDNEQSSTGYITSSNPPLTSSDHRNIGHNEISQDYIPYPTYNESTPPTAIINSKVNDVSSGHDHTVTGQIDNLSTDSNDSHLHISPHENNTTTKTRADYVDFHPSHPHETHVTDNTSRDCREHFQRTDDCKQFLSQHDHIAGTMKGGYVIIDPSLTRQLQQH